METLRSPLCDFGPPPVVRPLPVTRTNVLAGLVVGWAIFAALVMAGFGVIG
jgi:hypothetical protein